MALIPKPTFPNVPKLPGVPQLRRSPTFPAAPPRILSAVIAVGRLWQALFTDSGWGIYKSETPVQPSDEDGIEEVTVVAEREPVVVPDSFLEFGYDLEYSVADYPVQAGGFASYDKVAHPFETFVRMSKGGMLNPRKEFLDSIDAIVGTLDFYDIITPEKTYLKVNVIGYRLNRRGRQGAYFFTEVDLYFREIREVTATYSTTAATTPNAQDPSAVPATNTGTVQGQPTTATPDSLNIAGGGP